MRSVGPSEPSVPLISSNSQPFAPEMIFQHSISNAKLPISSSSSTPWFASPVAVKNEHNEGRLEARAGMESPMTLSDLQAKIDRIPWYHEFDFGQGLRARNLHPWAAGCRRIWQFIEKHLDGIDFRGKSVLDIGCWDGYWSFQAERRGAQYVLATDDVTQNWSGGEGLRIARQLLQSSVEINQQMSVYKLSSLNRKFDVVLCLGVFYHLIDPFRALAEIRHCCHDRTMIVFEGEMALCGLGRGAAQYRCGALTNRCPWAFLPSPSAFDNLLNAAYFRTQSRSYLS